MNKTLPRIILILIVSLLHQAFCHSEEADHNAVNKLKLEKLHTALKAYMKDHKGQWPQEPFESPKEDFAYFSWWAETLKNYKITKEDLTPAGALRSEAAIDLIFVFTGFQETPDIAYANKDGFWIIMSTSRKGADQLAIRTNGKVEKVSAKPTEPRKN